VKRNEEPLWGRGREVKSPLLRVKRDEEPLWGRGREVKNPYGVGEER